MKTSLAVWAFSGTFLFIFSAAHAFELDHTYGYSKIAKADPLGGPRNPDQPRNANRLPKFNLVLKTLGIPPENKPDFAEFVADETLGLTDVNTRLRYIDPDGGLKRYLNLSAANLSLYQDFFSALLPPSLIEYSVGLAPISAPKDSARLLDHLAEIRDQVKNESQDQPLKGLKFVIDPGHMGTDFWDHQTGKFVETKEGKVSEGDINLWTALLTANELEALGATVVLTRSTEGTVDPDDYQHYDVVPYRNQFFYDSLDTFMPKYLGLNDAEIVRTIKSKPEVVKAYSLAERNEFFVGDADLEARSQIVDRENPDVVIDIHYDALSTEATQTSADSVNSYVQGSFGADETGSRKHRSFALKHLLDTRRFDASVDLASEIVKSVSASTKVELQTSAKITHMVKVKDGVYTRNLYITRRNLSALMVYLECLHYDYEAEFKQMLNANQMASYHGTTFHYPARTQQVADGIVAGIMNYFRR